MEFRINKIGFIFGKVVKDTIVEVERRIYTMPYAVKNLCNKCGGSSRGGKTPVQYSSKSFFDRRTGCRFLVEQVAAKQQSSNHIAEKMEI